MILIILMRIKNLQNWLRNSILLLLSIAKEKKIILGSTEHLFTLYFETVLINNKLRGWVQISWSNMSNGVQLRLEVLAELICLVFAVHVILFKRKPTVSLSGHSKYQAKQDIGWFLKRFHLILLASSWFPKKKQNLLWKAKTKRYLAASFHDIWS